MSHRVNSFWKKLFFLLVFLCKPCSLYADEIPLILPDHNVLKEDNTDNLLFELNLAKSEVVTLTLKDILEQIESRNLQLLTEKISKKQKFYQYVGSYGNFLPSIGGSYTHSRFQGGIQIFGGENFKIFRTLIEPRATLSLPFQTGGRDLFLTLSSKNNYKASQHQYEQEKQNKLKEAAFVYYEIKRLHEVKKAVEQTLYQSKVEVNRAKTRYETGVDIKLPVLQAETQLANAKLKLIDTEKEIRFATEHLNKLLNLPFYMQVEIDQEEPSRLTLVDETLKFEQLIDIALKNRSDLLQKEREIAASKDRAKSIMAEILPTVNLGVSIAGSGPHLNDLSLNRSIELFVESNILENMGLNIYARYKDAKAHYENLKLLKEDLIKSVEEEIAKAYLNIKTEGTKISVAEIGLRSAEEAYHHASGRYSEGVGSYLDVIIALTDLLKAKENVSHALIDFNKAQIDVVYQLGLMQVHIDSIKVKGS